MSELTRDELLALLRVVMPIQAEVMLNRLGDKAVRKMADAFGDFEELSSVAPDSARVIQGLERLNHRLRLAMGEAVLPDDARPLR
ncbi:hypothetical protein CO540_19135 [Micromonospora sp. WMMA2032]|uniref:hypothetical protein n=1 Tax=Micromonospora sp. WMMA2032 TaxID=2039870 RepID=UPI000C059F2A|nr:hypothetical protein [Micromonospora sp. WMMA2032]ATO15690.1 hypothetical protein CO540_19135 [Micromonospora sp. WMMA2032]